MGLLDYASKTSANVLPKEAFETLVTEVFTTISEILERSLGPLGSSTLILDGSGNSATKDGFAIFKNLKFQNRFKAMIYNLIKAPCTKLNNTVGDGTTTAIVLTKLLFDQYQKNKNEIESYFRLPRTFTTIWDKTISELCELIHTYATPLSRINDQGFDKDDIYNLAYVISNGNDDISHTIASIYSESISPVIKIKNSPTNECYVESIRGFEFPANLIDEAFARNEDLSTIEKDIHVLIFGLKVDADIFEKIIVPMNDVYRADNKKLLVLSPSYDELVANTTMKTYINQEFRTNNGKLNLILTQYQYAKLADDQEEDLAAILNCKVINYDDAQQLISTLEKMNDMEVYEFFIGDGTGKDEPFSEFQMIGKAPSAQLSVTNGSIFSDVVTDGNLKYQRRISEIGTELERLVGSIDADKRNYSLEISKLRSRLAQLRMESYIYYVGADSSLQANVIYDSVDDVIKGVGSAVKFGVVPGCQLSIMKACIELESYYRDKIDIVDPTNLIDATTQKNNNKLHLLILQMIEAAVIALYFIILRGPNKDGIAKILPDYELISSISHVLPAGKSLGEKANDRFEEILRASLQSNMVFDVDRLYNNPHIVTSVETDISVLTAASELIKLLISGNQCLYFDMMLNQTEEVDM